MIHAKGQKRFHRWYELDYKPAHSNSLDEGASYPRNVMLENSAWTDASDGSQVQLHHIGGLESEWVEYYDASANAAYWYNTTTGEATWINPGGSSTTSGSTLR